MKKKETQELIGILFASRNFAHQRHLAARSNAEHRALGSFYEDIIPLADKLVEAWQGKNLTLLDKIDTVNINGQDSNANALQAQLEAVETYRKDVTEGYSPLNNIFDEIAEVYLSTIYKLTFLK